MSERTVSQTEHLYLVRAHAKAERARVILDDEVNSQKTTIRNLGQSLIHVCESLAEKKWCLQKAEEDVGSLQVELAAAHDVAQELNASNERLLERVTIAERRLRQAQSGETDEEVAKLRARLEAANRKLGDQEELISHAATQADELRTRAQKAEAELATVKLQHAKDHTAMCGYREANGEMSRQIAELEKAIDGLRAEVSHSTMEAPDAVA